MLLLLFWPLSINPYSGSAWSIRSTSKLAVCAVILNTISMVVHIFAAEQRMRRYGSGEVARKRTERGKERETERDREGEKRRERERKQVKRGRERNTNERSNRNALKCDSIHNRHFNKY